MTVGSRLIAPIIAATSPEEARVRALVLGDDLVQRRLAWLMEAGRTKPGPDSEISVTVGEPFQLHVSRSHR